LDFSGSDAIEIRLNDGDLHYRWEAARRPQNAITFDLVHWTIGEDGAVIPAAQRVSDLEQLCGDVARRRFDSALPFFTSNGSFWTGDTWEPLETGTEAGGNVAGERLCVGGHYRSLAIIRFFVDEQTIGLLHIKSERPNSFTEGEVEFYEGIAQTFGLAVADRQAEAALRERVKELTCLYGIAQVTERHGTALSEVLQPIVELLPPSWQYPEMTAARIVLDGHSYVTHGFRQSKHKQSAEILVDGHQRGVVEVVYLEERPELEAGAFLKEEEKLINAVAREVGLIVQRNEGEEEKSKLEQQLVHADRLSTIGELAAGVAHELNEPLSSILGFAQLGKDCPGLPEQAERDFEKVIRASLYAREVIRKLMVFSRQMPSKKSAINLNEVVEDALNFLEARCSKAGTQVVCELAPRLPEVSADPAQLKQVLVNLIVNAMQAMPDGGTLTVSTRTSDGFVSLVVRDTGVGMSPEVQEKIFLPFFSTKDVDEGTGLGLAVVHGIVNSHGGSIHVETQPGQGTQFRILFPTADPEETQEVD
jgi:signal transduction histidine kinase